MDLFAEAQKNQIPEGTPLPERMRPKILGHFLGQPNVTQSETDWIKLAELGRLTNLILWGPPGCGKTTFALLLAEKARAEVIKENAIDLGAKMLREIGDQSRHRRLQFQQQTLLFVDEIHRLNRSQQDVLLPFLEKGDVILIGATTENPSYELVPALLSRCRVLRFHALTHEDLRALLSRAFEFLNLSLTETLTTEAQTALIEMADGDARRLLNQVELLQLHFLSRPESPRPLEVERLLQILEKAPLRYDRDRDEHYDTISAFIKSVRGSDPNAAVYYLARMLAGGEDPVFVARRLVILASEDIGNADPRAITVATSALQAVELIGLPEAAIPLAQVTTYLASAPKSNASYLALKAAQSLVEKTGSLPIPLALRSAQTRLAKQMGHGQGYRYSHDGPKGFEAQQFLPDALKNEILYSPTDRGFEKNIRQYLEWMKEVPVLPNTTKPQAP